MDNVSGKGRRMVESDELSGRASGGGGAATAALQQCELIQNLIEISIASLQGLRTKCAATNDLTQQEIRTLEVKLVKYICKQLQCKWRVPEIERPRALDSYPRLCDWLCTINLRSELIQAVPVKLSLDTLLHMSGAQVRETMRKLGSSAEECSRLSAALSCLRGVTETGGDVREDGVPWISEPYCRDSAPLDQLTCPSRPPRAHSPSPLCQTPGTCPVPATPPHLYASSYSVPATPSADALAEPLPWHAATPPVTPPARRNAQRKPPRTPPPPSHKLLHLLPDITLPRSKSHEFQLANRAEDTPSSKCAQKNKPLLSVQVNGSACEIEDPASRSPLPASRSPTPSPAPYILPATPTLLENNLAVHRSSPQPVRRDIGLPVTHRFSTKSWLSQTCQVCQKNMMFGVKCKHCRLKCHNKCTKEAPSCRISFLPIPKIRRTESVPSDINNQGDLPSEVPQFGTLPKAIARKDHPPVLTQPDSSSNPSSTTSSTPSSPAPFPQGNPPSATPPPNPSPKVPRDNRFHFPAACYFQHRQQFIFPDVSSSPQPSAALSDGLHDVSEVDSALPASELQLAATEQEAVEEGEEEEEHREEDEHEEDGGGEREGRGTGGSDAEFDGDELEELPSWRGGRWRGPISRKHSQTSVYLQEWDVPFEQLDLGELIGRGRWGKVHKGRWHGEVAVRLLEIDGNNQDHLKLFKKEVMNYRQTRHENVVLFMGACMHPPHLAIITSFCKGRTLYSVVRDSKSALDINKTRQIAQEIVKGMGYLHAKGIVHKDLKSKNVFYDSSKVVIADFGLFGMLGVVQEGRREDALRLPHGWVCYLAPEIVQQLAPGNEDCLPFSNAADVYAFGTIWYELQARDWPITNQPAEAIIWQMGSGEGVVRVLSQISLGKEVTEILSACWSFDLRDRPTFTQLADMLERLPKLNRRLSHPGHFWKSAEL
ncbi:kinase suppressor of Ras 1-like isoform X4 [Anguilla anguilla]|uniref:kinase suppressor of Ras 1-like isoform X4 n=1 Tax=Anguilla anguilla TaxID=7936 RepID=UPI0015AA5ACE|nr:kinase suppressor of Ras 1-like isoform X4 [Anguilla anguilla]